MPVAAIGLLDRLWKAGVCHPVKDMADRLWMVLPQHVLDLPIELINSCLGAAIALYGAGTINCLRAAHDRPPARARLRMLALSRSSPRTFCQVSTSRFASSSSSSNSLVNAERLTKAFPISS